MSVPPTLKPIAHYIKIANEHSSRDPVVYYWSLYYAIQTGMNIDRKSPDALKFLTDLLGTLEQVKKTLHDKEGVTNEIVAQAHIEQVVLNLFIAADNKDRAGIADKNVVKAFYTAGHLFDVLTCFGELDEKLAENRKYAKWKAAYIHQCLKDGQVPNPGPIGWTPGDDDVKEGQDGNFGVSMGVPEPPPPVAGFSQPAVHPFAPQEQGTGANDTSAVAGVDAAIMQQAQKLGKMAISALDYEDIPTAILNFKKAAQILES